MTPVGVVVWVIRVVRVTVNRYMSSTVQVSMRIAGLVKEFRRANPEATADEVSEYVSRLERRLSVR